MPKRWRLAVPASGVQGRAADRCVQTVSLPADPHDARRCGRSAPQGLWPKTTGSRPMGTTTKTVSLMGDSTTRLAARARLCGQAEPLMINNRYRMLAAALMLDGYAVTAAVAASQWWHHQPGQEGSLRRSWCLCLFI